MSYGVDPTQHPAVPPGPDLRKGPGQRPPFGQVPAPEQAPPPGGYGQPQAYGQPSGYGQPDGAYGQPAGAAYGQPAGAPPVPSGEPVLGMAPPAGYATAPGHGGQAVQQGVPAGEVTVKPSMAQYRRFVGSGPIAAVALVAILYFRFGVVAMVVGLVVAVVALGGTLLYIQRTALRIDPVSVHYRHLVGARRFARADVGAIVLAPYQASAQDRRVLLTLLLRDRAGRKLLRLASSMWAPDDLERIAYSFGVAPRIHDELLTPKTLEAHHPGSTTWVERHPMLLALLIVVGIIVAIGVGAVAFG